MTSHLLAQVLLSLAFVVMLARIGGFLFARLGQPAVVGEIVAGILAGPSLLGLVAPGISRAILPTEVQPYLNLLAQLGLVLFMVVVGLEVETVTLGRRATVVAAVAAGATALPLALGAAVGLAIWPWYEVPAGRPPFVLFMGVALAVTAFPVLARIIRERNMSGSPVGTIAMACAAVIDVVAWLLLAAVVTAVGRGDRPVWVTLAMVTAFVAVMLGGVRPGLVVLHRRGLFRRLSPQGLLVAVLLAAVVAAWFTESIGLHSIFGPFLVGLSLPRSGPVVEVVTTRVADLSGGLLLPAFFVVAGLGVDVAGLDRRDLLVLAVVLAVAVGGKILGAAGPARLTGLDARESWTLGILLNTRGLTELVVLSVGASVGLLDADLFTILVLTAVATTMATGPLLALVERRRTSGAPTAERSRTPAST